MDRQKLLSIVGLLVALIAAVGPQIGEMYAGTAFGVGVAGVALAALGRGLTRTTGGSLAVTVIGCVVGVTGAVVPLLSDYPGAGAILMLVGTTAAVFGRQLFNFDPEGGGPALRAFFLALGVLGLAGAQAACDPLKVVKPACEEIAVGVASAPEVIAVFVEAGRLSEDEAERLRGSFERIGNDFRPLNEKVQGLQKLDARAALELLPHARTFVDRLDAENIINVSDPTADARFAGIRAVLQLVGRRVLARLESRSKGARPTEAEMREDKGQLESDLARLQEQMRPVLTLPGEVQGE